MAPKPELMTTTLWDFPSQQYGNERQGDKNYQGATPAMGSTTRSLGLA